MRTLIDAAARAMTEFVRRRNASVSNAARWQHERGPDRASAPVLQSDFVLRLRRRRADQGMSGSSRARSWCARGDRHLLQQCWFPIASGPPLRPSASASHCKGARGRAEYSIRASLIACLAHGGFVTKPLCPARARDSSTAQRGAWPERATLSSKLSTLLSCPHMRSKTRERGPSPAL